jgi:hypothetical protein
LLGGPSSVIDNFFELGGHSLLATQLSARIINEFGVDLSVRMVFEHPTIEALAAAIDGLIANGKPSGEANPLRPEPRLGQPSIAIEALSDGEVDSLLSELLEGGDAQ